MTRVVLIPPFPLNAIPYNEFRITIKRITIEKLKELIKDKDVLCYIRHPSTVQLLSKTLGLALSPSSQLYRYQEGDILVLVGLKKPIRGQEMQITLDDLDIAIATVEPL